MAIHKRGNGYQVNFTRGKLRYRKTFPTPSQARAWELDTLAKLERGETIDDLGKDHPASGIGGTTLQEMLYLTIEHAWDGSPSEQTSVKNAQDFIELLGGPDTVATTLDQLDVTKAVSAFKKKGLMESTINRKLAAISKLFTLSRKKGLTKVRLDFDQFPEPSHRVRFYTPEEEKEIDDKLKMLEMFSAAKYATFLGQTGLRTSEALRIQWADFADIRDESGQIIDKDFSQVYVKRKGGKTTQLPLTQTAQNILRERLSECRKQPWDDLNKINIDTKWRRMRRYLSFGNEEHIVWHTFRHTFCSRLAMAGVSLLKIKELAGHVKYDTTLRYAHLCPSDMHEDIQCLSQFDPKDDPRSP